MKYYPVPEIIKGYTCPDYEDCSKCELHNTDCIVYSKKGQQINKEYQEQMRKIENEKQNT